MRELNLASDEPARAEILCLFEEVERLIVAAREKERARLRPLLKRCARIVDPATRGIAFHERADLLADLRAELGEES